MLISKMNRFLDRHGRTALVIIAVAVIIPFLITWAPGGGGCRGRESVAPKSVGTMYGKPIKLATFNAQVSAVRLKMFLRFGRMMDDTPLSVIISSRTRCGACVACMKRASVVWRR